MVNNRNLPQQNPGNIVVGNGGGNSSYLDAVELKQVDVPTETIIGGANGAVKGAFISAAASALISAATKPIKISGGKAIAENLTGKHLPAVALATVAFTAMGAFVRNAHARMHNKWSDQQTELLEQQAKSHAERAEAPATTTTAPAR